MKRRILRVAVPAAVLLGLIAAWLVASGRLKGNARSDTLKLYGNVDIRQVELGFRVAGRVAAMKFEEGQAVEAGTVLAELDARSYEEDVRAARARVTQQAAALEKLERGPRPAEIAQARANLAERRASLENARAAFERAQKLYASEVIAKAGLDDARTLLETSKARVGEAAAALRLLEEGSRPEDVAAARASLELARARLAAAETALADTRLVSPAEGIVLSRVVEPGAVVAPSSVVYVLSLTGPVWVRAYIDERHLGRIHPGMEVNVISDSAPQTPYRGRIGFISPVAEFTPKSVETPELRTELVYRLRITVDQPGLSLRQGMPVTVLIPLPPRMVRTD